MLREENIGGIYCVLQLLCIYHYLGVQNQMVVLQVVKHIGSISSFFILLWHTLHAGRPSSTIMAQ